MKMFAKITNKYDYLSKFTGKVCYEYKCTTTMSGSTSRQTHTQPYIHILENIKGELK